MFWCGLLSTGFTTERHLRQPDVDIQSSARRGDARVPAYVRPRDVAGAFTRILQTTAARLEDEWHLKLGFHQCNARTQRNNARLHLCTWTEMTQQAKRKDKSGVNSCVRCVRCVRWKLCLTLKQIETLELQKPPSPIYLFLLCGRPNNRPHFVSCPSVLLPVRFFILLFTCPYSKTEALVELK